MSFQHSKDVFCYLFIYFKNLIHSVGWIKKKRKKRSFFSAERRVNVDPFRKFDEIRVRA